MVEQLCEIDKAASLLINGLNNSFFDHFFLEATHRFTWIPLYLALIWFLYRSYGLSFWRILIIIALMITVSDQISSFVFKPWFERLRPCDDPRINDYVHIVNGYKAGGYSFFSSHASNCAALFIFVLLSSRSKVVGVTLFLWTLINAYSRVYLGVHYVSDVFFGILVGVLLGILGFRLFVRFFSNKMKSKRNTVASYIVIMFFLCTIAYLLINKSIV